MKKPEGKIMAKEELFTSGKLAKEWGVAPKVIKAAIEKAEAEVETTHTPETIDIEKPGKYKIDVKGLLEEEPIIIQKDGSYTIHLPSIFKMLDKDKKD